MKSYNFLGNAIFDVLLAAVHTGTRTASFYLQIIQLILCLFNLIRIDENRIVITNFLIGITRNQHPIEKNSGIMEFILKNCTMSMEGC